MNDKLKRGVYNKIVNAVKQNPNIDNFVKDDSENYAFTCMVCGGMIFEFTLRKKADILTLKGTTPVITDLNENTSLLEVGAEVVEGTELLHVSYEDKLVFQHAIPLISEEMDSVEGQKQIFNATLGFIHTLCINKDKLGCSAANSSMASMDFTTEAEDDPYGFNDFSEDEDDGIGMDSAEAVHAFEDGTDVFGDVAGSLESSDMQENGVAEGADVQGGVYFFGMPNNAQPENMFLDMSGKHYGQPDSESVESDIFSDLDREMKEIEERRNLRKAEREAKRRSNKEHGMGKEDLETDAGLSEGTSNSVVPRIDNVDIFSSLFEEQDTVGSFGDNMGLKNTQPITEDDSSVENTNLHMNDGVEDTGIRVQARLADKESEKVSTDASSRNHGKHSGMAKKKPARVREKEESELSRTVGAEMDRNVDIGIEPVGYQRAPEVVEQMKHLYDEVDHVFAKRREQADFREQSLDEYAKRLEQREKEIEVRSERLEESYKNKQAELENKELGFETQRNEIAFQWEKLQAEKEMTEGHKKHLEELQAMLEKEREVAKERNVSEDDRSFVLVRDLEKKENEIVSLKDRVASMEKEHGEYVKSLQNQIKDLESSLKAAGTCSKDVVVLKARVKELEEELSDMTEDVKDMEEECEKKGRIISELRLKATSTASDAQAYARTEAEWIKKEEEYKKQIATLKADTGSEKEELMDKLDAANMKIKQLEAEASNSTSSAEDAATIKRLNMELAQAKSDLEKADHAYENEKKVREQEKRDAASSKVDVNAMARQIKEELSEIGVQVEPIATNGELVLTGGRENMQVVVNINAGILYIEKPVKRGVKYRSTLEQWNTEDIRTSYMFSEKKIIAKCTYDSIAKAAMDIVGRFSNLN